MITTKLTPRDKRLLFLTGMALLILVFVKLLILPSLDIRAELVNQAAMAQAMESQTKQKLAELPTLEASLEENKKLLAQADASLYATMANDKLDEMVTGLELSFGLVPMTLNITDAQPQSPGTYGSTEAQAQPGQDGYFLTATLRGTAQGSREDFIRLLDELDQKYPAIRVVDFSFSDAEYLTGELGKQKLTQISFGLEVYMCEKSR